jgi:outer membrane protein assembly factor BamB
MHFKTIFFTALVAGSLVELNAQEWSRFRGSDGLGISAAKTVPTKISAGDINWSAKLPGTGHSSPVAWGDRMFLTTSHDREGGLTVLCVNSKSGKTIWKKSFGLNPFRKHKYNSFASTTPALDGERLYVGWNDSEKYTLLCLTHDGEKVWERDLGPFVSQHGSGASPVLYEGKLILNSMKDDNSFVMAFNPKTGKTLWKNERPSKVAAYGSATVYQPQGGKPQLLFTSQADGIFSLDPDTGKQVWQMPDLFSKRSASTVVVAGDICWGSCGSGGGGNYVVAIRPGVPEKNIKPQPAWELRRNSMSPYVSTAVVQAQYAYLLSDAGFLTCIKHQTGEIIYSERLNTDGGRGANFFSSPLIIDGHLYCITTTGQMYILPVGPEYNVLSSFDFDGLCHATPAVHQGRLYVRTADTLFCIGG